MLKITRMRAAQAKMRPSGVDFRRPTTVNDEADDAIAYTPLVSRVMGAACRSLLVTRHSSYQIRLITSKRQGGLEGRHVPPRNPFFNPLAGFGITYHARSDSSE